MTMDKVSIIVPVYNKAWCITRCVESVLAQSFREFALILVNDGSQDESLSICKEFAQKDSRIQVIDKENGGVSTARNAGVEVSKGQYIVFLDADDWWEPDFLETMIPLAEEKGPETMVMCGFFRSKTTEQRVTFDGEAAVTLTDTGIYEIYCRHFLNMLWNKVFLGDIIRQQNIRFPKGIHWGEDKLFILEYLKNIKAYHIISKPLYHYDVSDGGLDNRYKKDELQLNEMLHRALFDFEKQIEGKTEEGNLLLCREYIRVQIQGAMRQMKLLRKCAPAKQLKQDALLRECMQKLQKVKKCSRWLIFCQKHSGLLLVFSYALKNKLKRC